MTKKRIIIAVIALAAAAALVCGGLYGYQWYQKGNLLASVEDVSMLNQQYWEEEMYSSGMVTNDDSQEVFLLEQQTLSEVHVEEDQEVKAGDPLISYDMTAANLKLEMQELSIQTIENDIILANRELSKLKATKPIVEQPFEPEPDTGSETEVGPEPGNGPEPDDEPGNGPEPDDEPGNGPEPDDGAETEEKAGEAYRFISGTAKPYKGKGTEKSPFVYLCTRNSYVEGDWLNSLADTKKTVYVILEIRVDDKTTGDLVASWEFNSSNLEKTEEGSKWSVKDKRQITELTDTAGEENVTVESGYEPENEPENEPEDEPEEAVEDIDDDNPFDIETGYTAEELRNAVKEQEQELKDLDLDLRKAKLELQEMKRISDTGTVSAAINGIVKSIGDPVEVSQNGSPFLVISGSEGLYVSGTVSELSLDKVKKGQVIYASSWESGLSFEATIQEISEYPVENVNGGMGNPNASYYPFTAYIENTEGIQNGDYVELTMNPTNMQGNSMTQEHNSIYLQKAYVREENGNYYVLKEDENKRLKKQFVKTGKTVYGDLIEIKSGLTLEDRITFPYGKTAKEGIKVQTGDETAELK